MVVNVGVKGFGHIGHLVTRAALQSGKVNIVAINDIVIDLNYMVYMFHYDSTHGKFNGTVKAENGKLVINGKAITIFQEQDPANIKWDDADADAKYDDIKKMVKQASEGSLKGFQAYIEDQVVSNNFNSVTHSSTCDAGVIIALNDNFVKLIFQYDNEFSCINRVVDLTTYMASKE
ncbi:hypothetical protein STEG23_028200 [Scotinomys teguina]